MKLKTNKTDIVIIVISLLVIIALSIVSFVIGTGSAEKVNVYYKNNIVYTMDLNQDEIYVMEKSKYSSLEDDLTIEIKNGKFRVAEETSKYNICSKVGWEDRPGFPVVCLPNYVMVVIEGYVDTGIDFTPVN